MPLKKGKYVKISVTDQGMGIPMEHLPNIFDPYFTTKQKGSGLGLAVAYSIVKKHGGHLAVESQLGKGTTFHLYLPAIERQIFTVEKIEEEKLPAGLGRILFMDDQPNIRKMVKQMLRHLGYEIEVAEDGARAVELYTEAQKAGEPFEAVVLDLTVPGGMGGEEAMRRFQTIDPEVKAIVSSGYANDPIISSYHQYGFSGVVSKPFDINELSKILHKVVPPKKIKKK